MTKQLLVARVNVITMIDDERFEIQAGDPLPDCISDHDISELKKMRAIEDVAESARAEKDSAKATAAAGEAFQAAREAVLAAAESIKVADEQVSQPGADGDKKDTTGNAGAAGGVGGADLKVSAAPKRQASTKSK